MNSGYLNDELFWCWWMGRWSFNYFFYNKKMKRILYFSSRCLSKMSSEESSSDDGTNEWGLDFVEGMDLED
jgi:hypothetical protein